MAKDLQRWAKCLVFLKNQISFFYISSGFFLLLTASNTASAQIASITLTPTSASVAAGGSQLFTARAWDTNGDPMSGVTFTWSSSVPSRCSVSTSSGNVSVPTNATAGTCTINASSGGVTGSATLTVTVNTTVATVTVTPTNPSVDAGSSVQLTATARDSVGNILTGQTFTWSTSTSMCTPNSSGLVTAAANNSGTCTITARASNGVTGSTTVNVINNTVSTVTISPVNPSINAGSTVQLTATARNSAGTTLTGHTFSWSSANTSICTVNSSGLVSSPTTASGSCTVSATTSGVTGSTTVSVTNNNIVATVTVTPVNPIMTGGETLQMTATAKNAAGTTLTGITFTWSSASTSICTVNTTGFVNAIQTSVGNCVITATASGVSGNTTVTVDPPLVSVTPASNPYTFENDSENLKACVAYAKVQSTSCLSILDMDDSLFCLATNRARSSSCNGISDPNLKTACIGMVAKTVATCSSITDPGLRVFCQAVAGNKSNYCNALSGSDLKKHCQAQLTNSTSSCSTIVAADKKKFCLGFVGKNYTSCGTVTSQKTTMFVPNAPVTPPFTSPSVPPFDYGGQWTYGQISPPQLAIDPYGQDSSWVPLYIDIEIFRKNLGTTTLGGEAVLSTRLSYAKPMATISNPNPHWGFGARILGEANALIFKRNFNLARGWVRFGNYGNIFHDVGNVPGNIFDDTVASLFPPRPPSTQTSYSTQIEVLGNVLGTYEQSNIDYSSLPKFTQSSVSEVMPISCGFLNISKAKARFARTVIPLGITSVHIEVGAAYRAGLSCSIRPVFDTTRLSLSEARLEGRAGPDAEAGGYLSGSLALAVVRVGVAGIVNVIDTSGQGVLTAYIQRGKLNRLLEGTIRFLSGRIEAFVQRISIPSFKWKDIKRWKLYSFDGSAYKINSDFGGHNMLTSEPISTVIPTSPDYVGLTPTQLPTFLLPRGGSTLFNPGKDRDWGDGVAHDPNGFAVFDPVVNYGSISALPTVPSTVPIVNPVIAPEPDELDAGSNALTQAYSDAQTTEATIPPSEVQTIFNMY